MISNIPFSRTIVLLLKIIMLELFYLPFLCSIYRKEYIVLIHAKRLVYKQKYDK